MSPHKEDQGYEYQSDDEFGRVAEATDGQLLRRTGACGRRCVLCSGRRGEIDRRDRVRMLVTNIDIASYNDELLRVIAVNGLTVLVLASSNQRVRKNMVAYPNK